MKKIVSLTLLSTELQTDSIRRSACLNQSTWVHATSIVILVQTHVGYDNQNLSWPIKISVSDRTIIPTQRPYSPSIYMQLIWTEMKLISGPPRKMKKYLELVPL